LHFQTMMAASRQCHDASGGAFNPAVGPLVEAWGFFRGGAAHDFPPSETAIAEALALCDFAQVELHGNGATRLNREGMRLDFGAIAKGYAVDVAFERLLAAGHSNLIVNLGGNMRCEGERPGGGLWRVAVRDPRGGLDGEAMGMLRLGGGLAVATSGDYEQFFELDGRRYSHIMDPRTGRPVAGMAQVTVVARTAAEADALSTACFVLGAEAGAALLAKHPGSGAMFVTVDESGALTATMAGDFVKHYREER
jgi:thiamine biosynthesis lipoprotein